MLFPSLRLGGLIVLTLVATLTAGAHTALAQVKNPELEALKREIEELRRSDAEKQRKLDELQRRIQAMESQPVAVEKPAAPESALDRALKETNLRSKPRGPISSRVRSEGRHFG
jgi:septal ring factor EnvC (AmiA/AmiB activator)